MYRIHSITDSSISSASLFFRITKKMNIAPIANRNPASIESVNPPDLLVISSETGKPTTTSDPSAFSPERTRSALPLPSQLGISIDATSAPFPSVV